MKKINLILSSIFLTTLFFNISNSIASDKKEDINWIFKENCSNPESVYYDPESELIFVSNVSGEGDKKDGVGHISKLNTEGKVLNPKWIKGLNAPKGMRVHAGKLWVSDIDQVVVIDIEKGMVLKKIDIKGAKFLNDIAIGANGVVYVSDTLTSSIHKIENGKATVFVTGKIFESPNGLLINRGKLYVAAWGLTTDWSTKILGRLYSIDLSNKSIKMITKEPLGNLDGLEIDTKGNFIISDWVSGKIYKVNAEGESKVIYSGMKGLADIGIIPKKNQILIPYMLNNKVVSISL